MMFESEMRIEIERRVIAALDERAGKGLPAVSLDSLRAIVCADLTREVEDKRQAVRPAPKPAPVVAPVAPLKPVLAPVPPPKRSVPVPPPEAAAPAPSPIALAERVRAQRIIAMTPKGAEDECGDAIRSGMPIAEFEGVLAARAILNARRLAQGR